MKLPVLLSCLLGAWVGCGARSPMDTCAGGAEQCACVAGKCNRGLVCVADVCVSQGVAPMGSGGAAGSSREVTTGGGVGTGGRRGSGGQPGSGGYLGSGGTTRTGSGGYFGTGGTTRLGGVAGSSSRGGSGGAGGSSAAVTFMQGRADGAMKGWAWVDFGVQDSVGSPTCAGQPLMSAAGCPSSYDWSTSIGLCISGTIPQVTNGDYSSNWGIMVAAECRDPAGGTLGVSYSGITINVTGTPSSGLRALVHRHYDQDSYNYCAFFNSGTRVLFTSFNTACWDGTGAALTLADVPDIDWIAIMVPSLSTTPIRVSNLCWQWIMLD